MTSSPPSTSSLSHIPPEILSARPYLLSIDRTNRGMGRYELTSFFANPSSLPQFVSDVCAHFAAKLPVDAVVGLDALGFPLAGAMALRLGVGCVLARKRGKLALPKEEIAATDGIRDYSVERAGEKGLEIRKDLLRRGMRVIVVDEWIDSGAQMTAICETLEKEGVQVVGIATLQLRAGKREGADKVWERWDVFAADRSPVVQ